MKGVLRGSVAAIPRPLPSDLPKKKADNAMRASRGLSSYLSTSPHHSTSKEKTVNVKDPNTCTIIGNFKREKKTIEQQPCIDERTP